MPDIDLNDGAVDAVNWTCDWLLTKLNQGFEIGKEEIEQARVALRDAIAEELAAEKRQMDDEKAALAADES